MQKKFEFSVRRLKKFFDLWVFSKRRPVLIKKRLLLVLISFFALSSASLSASFTNFAVGGVLDTHKFISFASYGESYGVGILGHYDGSIFKGVAEASNRKEHTGRVGLFCEYRHRIDEKVYVNAGFRIGGLWGRDNQERTIEGGFFWTPYMGLQTMLTERFMLGGYVIPFSGESFEASNEKTHRRWVGQVGIQLYYML